MDKKPEKGLEAFRYLSSAEFHALPQEERVRYLERAISAIRRGQGYPAPAPNPTKKKSHRG